MGLSIGDLSIKTPAFNDRSPIPDRFTKYNDNIQPEIHISGVPEGTRELAVICHDPDAPMPFGFTHWTLYGISPSTTLIPEDAGGLRAGPNDFGETGYGGPQPPPGHGVHSYYFWVYALDTTVEGEPERDEFLRRYGDNILEQNRVVGFYERG